MINKELIRGRLQKLERYTEILKGFQNISLKEFKDDPSKYGSVAHFFQIAIECCIDIGNHIISRKSFRRPEGYKDVFTILGEEGIVPLDFVEDLRDLAGFRNRLVHLYWDVDLDIVYDKLQNRLGDFEKFASYIAKMLIAEER
ncbi:MAG: DUF86 domain-containing protein [bacterium]